MPFKDNRTCKTPLNRKNTPAFHLEDDRKEYGATHDSSSVFGGSLHLSEANSSVCGRYVVRRSDELDKDFRRDANTKGILFKSGPGYKAHFDPDKTPKMGRYAKYASLPKPHAKKKAHMHCLPKISCMEKAALVVMFAILIAYTFIVVFGELFLLPIDKSIWCSTYAEYEKDLYNEGKASDNDSVTLVTDEVRSLAEYSNPDYITDPCRYERIPFLGWLTIEECDLSRRLFTSVILGGAIGFERRSVDRPAGIRTMGLVSLGSCFFTICSMLALKASTMEWDSSRVTAAIPSGVGFMGAGLIWKGNVGTDGFEVHQVHGLTTAASLWLSAAIGVGAGGGMYFNTIFATVLVILVLRHGPKFYLHDETSFQDEDENDNNEVTDEDVSESEDELDALQGEKVRIMSMRSNISKYTDDTNHSMEEVQENKDLDLDQLLSSSIRTYGSTTGKREQKKAKQTPVKGPTFCD